MSDTRCCVQVGKEMGIDVFVDNVWIDNVVFILGLIGGGSR
jgi:hypothetical protein